MRRGTFVKLAALAFGLVIVSFVILGFSRIVLSYRTARLLAAPTTLLAALLVAVLFGYSVLVALDVREIE